MRQLDRVLIVKVWSIALLSATVLSACGGGGGGGNGGTDSSQGGSSIASPAATGSTDSSPTIAQLSASGALIMPLEVMSAGSGKVVSATLQVPAGAAAKVLTMQVNNLSYDGKGSIQINGGNWITLTNASVTVLGNAKLYGGIGGGYDTISLNVPITGAVNGANTINFRFNTTDGVSSGYRVLSFNLLDSGGNKLIAASSFTQDDPTAWTAPLPNASDIAAGQQLWQSAQLIESPINAGHQLQAHCMDCHSASGSDLFKFNYSNNSIVVRSQFHGLNATQGAQIASYIRSLKNQYPTPGANCRPWNPPYQPGPGLDSAPVSDWTCGAGLGAVSENDLDTLASIFPNGAVNRSLVATKSQINLREIPIALQLPDWNHWVPHVHPKDAWGDYFTNSNVNKMYAGQGTGNATYNMRSQLAQGGVSYAQGKTGNIFNDLYYWGDAFGDNFTPPNEGTSGSYTIAQQESLYGTAQWQLLKSWELAQEYSLEQSCPSAWVNLQHAPKPEARGWCGYWRVIFNVSPHILNFPTANSMFGSSVAQYVKSNQWYYLQILLNPGSGAHNVQMPVDWQYAYGLLDNLRQVSGRAEPIRNFLYVLKGTQEMDNGVGVANVNQGWTTRDTSPLDVWSGGQNGVWKGTSVATEQAVVNAFLANWVDTTTSFNLSDWQREGQPNTVSYETTCGWSIRSLCALDYVPGTLSGGTVENFPTWMWNKVPLMRGEGVDGTQLNRLVTWLNSAYPSGNYSNLLGN
ncbi:hypothetical protein [Paraburkholderia antibiotica]|uniref:Cytochrome c domain-containing protein n=1 Tax=Paraburkholderia antibiotica TaxID=2728839 RepID=A0A7X9ZY17_9BURK|nr:hypothetical protein [Paraburkholderia antibiotica]NML30908.1 hypothetical protein [Paraburkholderia antibiotica]